MSRAICLACGTVLESKHRHDYVVCPCPNKTMLDGGNDYERSGGVDMRMVHVCRTPAEAKRLHKLVLERNFARYREHLDAQPQKVSRRDTLAPTPLQIAKLRDLAQERGEDWTTIRSTVALHLCIALKVFQFVELNLDVYTDDAPSLKGYVRILPKGRQFLCRLDKKVAQ